jgi:hypothetical protein
MKDSRRDWKMSAGFVDCVKARTKVGKGDYFGCKNGQVEYEGSDEVAVDASCAVFWVTSAL